MYTSPYTRTDNSIIEQTYVFLKVSLGKPICSHQIDWDEIAVIATMAYNVFPHSSAGEAPLYLMFTHEPFMSTLFN